MKKLSALVLLCSLFLFTGCVEKMLTFGFTQADNPELASDMVGVINQSGKTITVSGEFPNGISALKASFTFKGSKVLVGTTQQASGVTLNNFLNTVTYTVTYLSLFTKEYQVTVTNNAAKYNTGIQGGITSDAQAVIAWAENGKIILDEKRNGVWTHESSACPVISLSGSDAINPKVLVEPSGRTVVVWAQKVDGNWCIFMSDYKDGVWTNPSSLNDHINTAGGDALYPNVTSDKNGFAVISYEQDNDIWGYEYLNGAWAGPWTLNNEQRNIVSGSSRFAMDASGHGLIVWNEQDTLGNTSVYMRQLLDGASWSGPLCISTSGAVTASPDIAMSDNGDAIAFWLEDGGIVVDQFKDNLWSNVAIGGNRRLNAEGSDASSVKAAMNSSGDAVLTWIQDSAAYETDVKNDTWHSPQEICYPLLGEVTNPSVSVLDDAWFKWVLIYEQDMNIWGYVAYFDDTWGYPNILNTDDSRDIVRGSSFMITDNSGIRGLIIWRENDKSGIFMREYYECAWTPAVNIN